jgi:ribonucleotide monophosphatase NagD (HAD superfamily)
VRQPLEDIKGAQAARMKTIFVSSQFYSLKDRNESRQKLDLIMENVRDIHGRLSEILAL